jgi:hypothetical protein
MWPIHAAGSWLRYLHELWHKHMWLIKVKVSQRMFLNLMAHNLNTIKSDDTGVVWLGKEI